MSYILSSNLRIRILVDLRIKEEISTPERPYFGSFQAKLTMQFSWQYQKPFALFCELVFPRLTQYIYWIYLWVMGTIHLLNLKIYIAFTPKSNGSGLKMDQAYVSWNRKLQKKSLNKRLSFEPQCCIFWYM